MKFKQCTPCVEQQILSLNESFIQGKIYKESMEKEACGVASKFEDLLDEKIENEEVRLEAIVAKIKVLSELREELFSITL